MPGTRKIIFGLESTLSKIQLSQENLTKMKGEVEKIADQVGYSIDWDKYKLIKN